MAVSAFFMLHGIALRESLVVVDVRNTPLCQTEGPLLNSSLNPELASPVASSPMSVNISPVHH
jgi:hypothetical protein